MENLIPFLTDEKNMLDYFEMYHEEELQGYTVKMKMLITVHQLINLSEEFAAIFSRVKLSYFNRLNYISMQLLEVGKLCLQASDQ